MYILLGIVVLLLAVGLGFSFYLTRRFHLRQVHTPAEVGLDFEEITFQAGDGIRLRGWLVPVTGSRKAVMLLHGHSGSIDYDISYLPYLHKAGYSVLQFDGRGHGRSEGSLVTFGYLEQRDIQAAALFLSRRGYERIAVMGFSLGGMCAITGAAVSPQVNVVIEDGAPIRLSSAIRGWIHWHKLPAWLAPALSWLVIGITSLRLRTNLYLFEPVRWVSRLAPRPFMVIHGEQDPSVSDFNDLLAAAQPTETWRMPDEAHVTAVSNRPGEYWERVTTFLNQHL